MEQGRKCKQQENATLSDHTYTHTKQAACAVLDFCHARVGFGPADAMLTASREVPLLQESPGHEDETGARLKTVLVNARHCAATGHPTVVV